MKQSVQQQSNLLSSLASTDPALHQGFADTLTNQGVPSPEELTAARRFLTQKWIAWGSERNRSVTSAGEGMCRFTSAFLCLWLGKGWRFASGYPSQFHWGEGRTVDVPKGFFDGKQWCAHHWATNGKTIIDLTASQFGADAIIVTPCNDRRYGETLCTPSEVREAIRDVKNRATDWLREFAQSDDPLCKRVPSRPR